MKLRSPTHAGSIECAGILVERAHIGEARKKSFQFYADITRVDWVGAARDHVTGAASWSYVVLRFADRRSEHIRIEQPNVSKVPDTRAFMIAGRVQRALDDYHARHVLEVPALQRRARTSAESFAALRDLARHPSYRQPALTDERLRALAENARADAGVRAAAAVLLRLKQPNPSGKPRVRIAVDAVALPELGEALRRVSDAESEEELLAALEMVEEQSKEVA